MPNFEKPKRILVAPLDWGLGHATRCIPVIRELKKKKAEVFIASSGSALLLLKEEFPELTFFEIAPYGVHYSRVLPFMVSMFFQLPKFMQAIRKEHEQIGRIVSGNKIDVIISDNRFGCRAPGTISVFITHQVTVLMPPLLKWIGPLINYFNQREIRKFDLCWVPDESDHRMTGTLTRADHLSLRYIGMLSRFEKLANVDKKYDLLVLLSGPEPQRTVMEEVMLKQLAESNLNVLLVRGLPGNKHADIYLSKNSKVENHLNAGALNRAIEESEMIICRSGYSTIMDLARLNKKAILIPTSGQTEQEYLAKRIFDKKIAFVTQLNDLAVAEAMASANDFSGFSMISEHSLLSTAINELLTGTTIEH